MMTTTPVQLPEHLPQVLSEGNPLANLVSFEQALRAIVVLNVFDMISTQIWVSFGITTEANPLMETAMAAGPVGFFATKMALISLAVGLLWRYRDRRMARIAAVPLALLYAFIGGGHVGIMALILA